MSKKTGVVLALTIPMLLLAGCMGEKEDKIIQPDKEPSETVRTIDEDELEPLTISTATALYDSAKSLEDYKEDFKKMGYAKPYKEMLLGFSDQDDEHNHNHKKGVIYKVEDGFAMIEYDLDAEEVIAITGYQNETELNIQEMKTKAFEKEKELSEEQDAKKREELKTQIDSMWEEITKLEQNEQ